METKSIVLQVGRWDVRIYEDFLIAENKKYQVACFSNSSIEVKDKKIVTKKTKFE